MTLSRRTFLTWLCPAVAAAQTLAHPGWRGNGIAAERWWQQASIVALPADTTFAGATAALDSISTAGMDTLLLPDLQPSANGALPFAQRFGSADDLDTLLREASARRMHVLLAAPLLRLANSEGELRFWLTRGIAGFQVGPLRAADVDTLHLLRSAMDRSPGERLLLVSLDAAEPELAMRFQREFQPPTLRLLSQAEAVSLPPGSKDAVLVTDMATAPTLRGSLPVVPLAAVQSGAAAMRQWLARNRTRTGRLAPSHHSSHHT